VTLGPVVPTAEVLGRIRYPVQARRQGIQATVELELLVEADGTIGQITVVKDPGWGFAAAAIAALDGVRCTPARVDGEPRAVRYRYPVRFVLTPAR
jgi:protein TonB